MNPPLECIDSQHLSLFEVRIKAIVASRLGVFGPGVQMEDQLMQSISSKSPEAVGFIDKCIGAYRNWHEACNTGAPQNAVEQLREAAIDSFKKLMAYLDSYAETAN